MKNHIYVHKSLNALISRTTTPNSLREALRETLVKNLESSGNDLSDTIVSIRDDEIQEIQDTFDVDAENIETPPVGRRNNMR